MALINADELARRLEIPKTWVYDRTRQGVSNAIPHLKLGKYVRFDWDSPEFQKWLKSHQRVAGPAVSGSGNRDSTVSL